MEPNKRHMIAKKALFGGLLFMLFLPMIQQATHVVGFVPLKGAFETPERPEWSLKNWFEGEFQAKTGAWLDHNIGFRNPFVRLYNQMHYTLYNEARANGVMIGKDNYLYEENYIKAHLGRDFLGRDSIRVKINQLTEIRDTLASKGIDLVVLLAPGKGAFYPEYIPARYDTARRTTTNYEVYREELAESGIPLLDFHQWFRSMKAKAPYPLFPRTGIHWSKYGEALAADSLIEYVYKLRNKANKPEVVIGEVEPSARMRGTDEDIEQGMNLLFDIGDLEMGYPEFQIRSDSSSNTVKVLSVADSYYWGLHNYGVSRDAFNDGQFWFYNRQIYPADGEPLDVQGIDIAEAVERHDVVLLLSTDANLFKFPFGFAEQLHDAYFNAGRGRFRTREAKKARVQYYIRAIKGAPDWLEKITENARKENVPLEEAIRKNAEYMVWQEQAGKDGN